jgi:hypothetical protein
VPNRGEPLKGGSPNSLSRGILLHEARMSILKSLQLSKLLIILSVTDSRLTQDVVAIAVLMELLDERIDPTSYLGSVFFALHGCRRYLTSSRIPIHLRCECPDNHAAAPLASTCSHWERIPADTDRN